MKKSKLVSLVLITAALASCNKKVEQDPSLGDWGDEKGGKKVYMRSDSTAQYTRTHHHSGMGMGSMILWYYAFRPYHGGGYGGYRSGYYSGGLSHSSNVGSNPAKSNVSRGGFGRSSFRSSAS